MQTPHILIVEDELVTRNTSVSYTHLTLPTIA